jgi:hypothetical protein
MFWPLISHSIMYKMMPYFTISHEVIHLYIYIYIYNLMKGESANYLCLTTLTLTPVLIGTFHTLFNNALSDAYVM